MSITDELRAWAKEHLSRSSILAIADRIDTEHGEAIASMMNDALYHANDKDMADLGWYRALDADGVPIRVGDVMETGDGDVFTVSSVDYGLHPSNGRGKFWMLWNEDGDVYECAYECRHHKQPTVEDVLREMAAAYMDTPLDDSNDGEFFAKYAAKLRLAGDAE